MIWPCSHRHSIEEFNAGAASPSGGEQLLDPLDDLASGPAERQPQRLQWQDLRQFGLDRGSGPFHRPARPLPATTDLLRLLLELRT